jgi:hypothetical protein
MNASVPLCAPTADAAFGPAVDGCRDGFDFTLVFEQSILVILPAALLLVAAPFRLLRLGKAPLVVGGPTVRNIKLVSSKTSNIRVSKPVDKGEELTRQHPTTRRSLASSPCSSLPS